MTELPELLRSAAGDVEAGFTADDIERTVTSRRRRRRRAVLAGAGIAAAVSLLPATSVLFDKEPPPSTGVAAVEAPPSAERITVVPEASFSPAPEAMTDRPVLGDGFIAELTRTTRPAPWMLVVRELPSGEERFVAEPLPDLPNIVNVVASGSALAWVSNAMSGDGHHDSSWRIETYLDGRRSTVARSRQPGSPELAISWPWLAWTEATLTTEASSVFVADLRSGVVHEVDTGPAWLVAVDGNELWLRKGNSVLRQPVDGSGQAELFLQAEDLADVAIAHGTAAWMTRPERLHPATGTLFASKTDVFRPVEMARRVDMTTCGTQADVPCSGFRWGDPSPGANFLTWTDTEDGLLAAPLSAPKNVTKLRRTEYGSDFRAQVAGDRIAWQELTTDGSSLTLIVRLVVG